MLRGRALEIVDERGKVRAQLQVFPPDPKHKLPNGDPYPETVLLRLIDPNGRPSVKLATDVRGGGLYLGARRTRPWPGWGRTGRKPAWSLSTRIGRRRSSGPEPWGSTEQGTSHAGRRNP